MGAPYYYGCLGLRRLLRLRIRGLRLLNLHAYVNAAFEAVAFAFVVAIAASPVVCSVVSVCPREEIKSNKSEQNPYK